MPNNAEIIVRLVRQANEEYQAWRNSSAFNPELDKNSPLMFMPEYIRHAYIQWLLEGNSAYDLAQSLAEQYSFDTDVIGHALQDMQEAGLLK